MDGNELVDEAYQEERYSPDGKRTTRWVVKHISKNDIGVRWTCTGKGDTKDKAILDMMMGMYENEYGRFGWNRVKEE